MVDLPIEVAFNLTNTAQIAELTLQTSLENRWAVFRAQVTGPDGEAILVADRLVEYYFGRRSGESWSEGSPSSVIRFHAETRAPHILTLSYLEGEASRLFTPSMVGASVAQGKPTGLWMRITAAFFGLGHIAFKLRRAAHLKRRHAGSDWHEY